MGIVTEYQHIADITQGELTRHVPPSLAQFSHSVMSNSLQSHGLQHSRLLYHQLLELAQTHVRRVNDAIQSSHPLSSPFPPALNLFQDQGLFN